MAIRKILVAIKNPDARHQPGAWKALRIAKSLGASVEFFHAISSPVFLELQPLTGQSIAELRREALALRLKRLERILARARVLGVKATATVEWDFPPHEAIVRRSTRSRADLIVAEYHRGSRGLGPWLMRLTDWELLRTSPVLVLLLKNSRPWRKGVLLAAVDPSHAHAKPSRLDSRLLDQGRLLAARLGGQLHVMHANSPESFALTLGDPAFDAAAVQATYEQLKARNLELFNAFAARARVPEARRHVVESSPHTGIPVVARKIGADLLIMGAVSRSGLKRVFIGNTAERVLAELPCDVLVVKPASFRKRVPGRVRGMKVIPPRPILPPTA